MSVFRPIDPALVYPFLDERGADLLTEYFNSGRYTGGRFERFAGGGDRDEIADLITTDDIVAVSLLGVRIPGRPALAILDDRRADLSAILSEIPMEVDLWKVPEEAVGPESAAMRLWSELIDLPGISWVTAGKLLARKRPRLIPVYDRVVKSALHRNDGEGWWQPLRSVLVENAEIVEALERLRTQASLGHDVSLLRVLDVCIWMRAYGEPEPVPDAET